ncbi:MAG: histidine phosphatase family protein [Dyella sp.]
MLILLARHGQTLWNHQGRLQGQRDSPLTAAGIAQARLLGKAWQARGVRRLVASTLARTLHTAHLVGEQLTHATLNTDPRLVEQSFGDAEGMLLAEARACFPVMPHVLDGIDAHATAPSGESLWQTIERARVGIQAVVASRDLDDKAPLGIISHGRVLQGLVWWLSGADSHGSARFRHANASYCELDVSAGEIALLRWGITSHLDAAETLIPA